MINFLRVIELPPFGRTYLALSMLLERRRVGKLFGWVAPVELVGSITLFFNLRTSAALGGEYE